MRIFALARQRMSSSSNTYAWCICEIVRENGLPIWRFAYHGDDSHNLPRLDRGETIEAMERETRLRYVGVIDEPYLEVTLQHLEPY